MQVLALILSVLCTESLTRLDMEQKAHSASYAGGDRTGQSWTDRVMGVKSTQDVPQTLPQDQLEGVADDEWVGGA